MAESAVVILLDKLVPWAQLADEVKLSSGVRGEVEYIRDELQSMRGFLRDADARGGGDEAFKAWVKQVREVAYDTEDILDEFMLRLAQPLHRHGFIGFLHNPSSLVKQLKARRCIASQIQEIKARVNDISERSRRFTLTNLGTSSSLNSCYDLRGNALLLEEAEVVGIERTREQLVGWLLEGGPRLAVISVVGMGGLGKTTLVKKVYDDLSVKGSFQHHAWINISQFSNINNHLKEIIRKLFGEMHIPIPQDIDAMEDIELKVFINEFLHQKRYVIVLDDIWSIHAWEAIKYALPDGKNGSRIMITTRFTNVASFASSDNNICNLHPLPPEESWTLFCRKAFREAACPQYLKDISQSILQRCEGLPLAIVTISGLLSTKDKNKIDEWEIVHRSLGAALETDDCLKILSLSYDDLPYYLKSCFLYLGLFPEDYMIKPNKLIRLWIAEGFVEKKERKTLEEVAQNYLCDLINRSLIQVGNRTRDGRTRRCRIHDLLREIILSKLRDQDFGVIAGELLEELHEKVRRLSVHNDCQSLPNNKRLSHLRSLLVFGVDKFSNSSSLAFFGGFRVLRVLDLKGALFETFPNEIVNLFHLRYLSLRRTKVKVLPNSIDKLVNLEILDLKHAYVSELPNGILKLQKLRHLLICRYKAKQYRHFDSVQGFKAPMGIGSLVSLQKLLCVEADHGKGIIRELGRLSQLRTLRINKLRREDGVDLCPSIEKMKYLHALEVISTAKEELLDLHYMSYSHQLLHRLILRGRLDKLPDWIASLQNLCRLCLCWCRLKKNPLEDLEALPNLMDLNLWDAYDGEVMRCRAGGFQKLKFLSLDEFKGLKMLRVQEDGMRNLSQLMILRCGHLERVPSGIEHLNNLKELHFADMPDELRMRVCTQGEERWKVAHIPNILFFYWKGGAWDVHRV